MFGGRHHVRLSCSKRRMKPRLVPPCACATAATSTTSMREACRILLVQSSACSGLIRRHWRSCGLCSVLQPWTASGMKWEGLTTWDSSNSNVPVTNLGRPPRWNFCSY